MRTLSENELVLSSLCAYDPRNPYKFSDEERREDCNCDNCFYGRTELAEMILEMNKLPFSHPIETVSPPNNVFIVMSTWNTDDVCPTAYVHKQHAEAYLNQLKVIGELTDEVIVELNLR